MRIPHTLLVLAALAGSASAKTSYHRTAVAPVEESSAFSFGHATKLSVERADLTLTTEDTRLRGTLRIVLSTWDDAKEDRSILLAVPEGTEITTMTLDLDGRHFVAAIGTAPTVRQEYEDTVRVLKDPALLEWVSSSTQHTLLRLRVFPITPRAQATIQLGFTLPHTASIAIDPNTYRIGHASIFVDGNAVSTDQLDERLEVPLPEPTVVASARVVPRAVFVNRKQSLYAGPEGEQEIEAEPTDASDAPYDGRPSPRVAYERYPIPKR